MASIISQLADKKLCHPPKWLPDNVHYEVVMGSIAYGVNTDTSDIDVYGFCIPPKDDIFPHLRGEIPGFGTHKHRFEQYQKHHIIDTTIKPGKEYDVSIYSIVKYFQLVMSNNPNMIDSLYVPSDCVLHITSIGQMVRDSRKIFLHKGCWHKFRGYAYGQLSKMKGKSDKSKRWESIQEYGYDLKFAYHTVRLVLEVEQLLAEETIDLRCNSAMLKSIRRGEWTESKVRDWFSEKEGSLEPLYHSSKLPYKPDEARIKELLLNCLEQHYGNLSNIIARPSNTQNLISGIEEVLSKYKG